MSCLFLVSITLSFFVGLPLVVWRSIRARGRDEREREKNLFRVCWPLTLTTGEEDEAGQNSRPSANETASFCYCRGTISRDGGGGRSNSSPGEERRPFVRYFDLPSLHIFRGWFQKIKRKNKHNQPLSLVSASSAILKVAPQERVAKWCGRQQLEPASTSASRRRRRKGRFERKERRWWRNGIRRCLSRHAVSPTTRCLLRSPPSRADLSRELTFWT